MAAAGIDFLVGIVAIFGGWVAILILVVVDAVAVLVDIVVPDFWG
jgi:hypothetical protein